MTGLPAGPVLAAGVFDLYRQREFSFFLAFSSARRWRSSAVIFRPEPAPAIRLSSVGQTPPTSTTPAVPPAATAREGMYHQPNVYLMKSLLGCLDSSVR